ncbi:MAG: ceramidase domain-containing protein [Pseudomonadota bacterium]|nr:ceramidase domain-containing protein [Pseudomonadota bacterium]
MVLKDCWASGLSAWDQVSCYCERAGDPGFWAEPANALSNAAFLVAAALALSQLRREGASGGDALLRYLLILLIAIVGIGSFLFHTYATAWSRLADVIPIGLFIALYVYAAFSRLVGLGSLAAAMVALTVVGATFTMPPVFNGSLGYAPALAALAVAAAVLASNSHMAARWMTGAAVTFCVSLIFRTVDRSEFICWPSASGTHWAWHLLNAAVLYMLMRALAGQHDGRGKAGKKKPASP